MRVAALYDIHGNLPALDAVLDEIAKVGADRIVIGGDVVPGPMPSETLERLRKVDLPIDFIFGNGELAVLAESAGKDSGVPAPYREATRWNAEQLEPSQHAELALWPATLSMHISPLGDVLFCHATPHDPNPVFTRLTSQDAVLSLVGQVTADLLICGHTHMQFDRTAGRLRIVNAGSVGMPFGRPGAYWLLLGTEVELRYSPYDLERAAARIRATSYPGAEAFAEKNVLQPASEEEMLQIFNRL